MTDKLTEAIGATPPGHLFADRELLNITRLGLSRIYTASNSEASEEMRECARQALARLEGLDSLGTPEPPAWQWPAGKTFGELSRADRIMAAQRACDQLQAELTRNAPAISEILEGNG